MEGLLVISLPVFGRRFWGPAAVLGIAPDHGAIGFHARKRPRPLT